MSALVLYFVFCFFCLLLEQPKLDQNVTRTRSLPPFALCGIISWNWLASARGTLIEGPASHGGRWASSFVEDKFGLPFKFLVADLIETRRCSTGVCVCDSIARYHRQLCLLEVEYKYCQADANRFLEWRQLVVNSHGCWNNLSLFCPLPLQSTHCATCPASLSTCSRLSRVDACSEQLLMCSSYSPSQSVPTVRRATYRSAVGVIKFRLVSIRSDSFRLTHTHTHTRGKPFFKLVRNAFLLPPPFS